MLKIQIQIQREVSPLYFKCLLKCFGKEFVIQPSEYILEDLGALSGREHESLPLVFLHCRIKLGFQRLLYFIE